MSERVTHVENMRKFLSALEAVPDAVVKFAVELETPDGQQSRWVHDAPRALLAELAAELADGTEQARCDDTRRLDALEEFATLSGFGFTNENGETEFDEVHAFEIHEDTIVDAMPDHWSEGDLGDCSNLRALADAIIAAQPGEERDEDD